MSGRAARLWAWLLGLGATLLAGTAGGANPSVALFYGPAAPLDELRVFDIVVVEPDHGYDPKAYAGAASQLFAYVAVGEVQPSRPYFKDLPDAWKLGANTAWGSVVVDQAQPEWPRFFAERVVEPLWQKGYRGFFLDTLDSYHLAGKNVDASRQQQGLIAVIGGLRARFPGIRLIANRGFEILPAVKQDIYAVAAESLFRGWDAATRRYVEVNQADRDWLLGQLRNVRELGLPVIAIDYVAPGERALTRDTAAKIAALGFIPWVADGALHSLGIGTVEVMPRKILVLYDGREAPALNFTNAHRYVSMPINHLGYVPEYVDVTQPLPAIELAGRYAGIVTWFAGGIAGAPAAAVSAWLRKQRGQGLRVAVLGDFGYPLNAAEAQALGLALDDAALSGRLAITEQDPMLGFEMPPAPQRRQAVAVRAQTPGARPLVRLADAKGVRVDAAAIMPWGGYALDPFVVEQVPAVDDQSRWVIDPFRFLEQALALPPLPVPDTTTENGRRLLFAHIDGDGFPSRAEFAGSPLAAEVLLREVLERYPVPTSMSVIEAEVARTGLHPEIAGAMEDVARRMFRLPHVEIASHTYSHPFHWGKAETREDPDDPAAYYALRVPGYKVSIEREIVGSVAYIRDNLAPAGKPVSLLLWSGDAAPGVASLSTAHAAGLLNMNGGNTVITRARPSLTMVSPLGIAKGGYFQTYAPVMNENVYTNLWRGPFYGFEQVIETFEMTEKPRRLKPINIYYHTYSASKPAALNALHKVYGWALKQPHFPLFATEFIRKVRDFNRMAVARSLDGSHWVVRGEGELRTLRLPAALGKPDVTASTNVAGYAPGAEGCYVHLAAGTAVLKTSTVPQTVPQLADANGRIVAWRRVGDGFEVELKGHAPLEFGLRGGRGCRVSSGGRPLAPQRTQGEVSSYRLRDAHTAIQVRCGNA